MRVLKKEIRMNDKISKKAIWDEAAKVGLIFGFISIIYMAGIQLLNNVGPTLASILSFILWLTKFIGCIALMKYFFVRLTKKYSGVTNKDTYKYGVKIALFSALLYAGYTLLYFSVISPEAVTKIFSELRQNIGSMMDSNTFKVIESMEESYASIAFFSNLIYSFIYGLILSAILASKIPAKDPFKEIKPSEE